MAENTHRNLREPGMERKNQSIREQLWLTYYNDVLYAQGVITEAEHRQMRVRIRSRPVSAKR